MHVLRHWRKVTCIKNMKPQILSSPIRFELRFLGLSNNKFQSCAIILILLMKLIQGLQVRVGYEQNCDGLVILTKLSRHRSFIAKFCHHVAPICSNETWDEFFHAFQNFVLILLTADSSLYTNRPQLPTATSCRSPEVLEFAFKYASDDLVDGH